MLDDRGRVPLNDRVRAPDLFRDIRGAVVGRCLSHQASRKFRVVAAVAAMCTAPTVAAPAAAAADTGLHQAVSNVPAADLLRVNDCYSTDNGDPRLVEFRYRPAKVNVVDQRAKVRFRVRTRDTGGPGAASGVRAVLVWFGTSGGDEGGTDGHNLRRAANGWWVGSVTVPRRTPHRLWPVEGLELRDRAGNGESYGRRALRELTGRSLDVSIATERDRASAVDGILGDTRGVWIPEAPSAT